MTSSARSNLLALGIAAIYFAAVAPTLPMLEFSNGAEALNVSTALEIRRTGNWLVPTLQGETRLAKPPLPAWITAAAIRQQTLSDIQSSDPILRDVAFRRLAWDVRAPALLAACIVALATFCMTRAVFDGKELDAALVALMVSVSTLLMLRFCRYATTDIYLAMFVAIANACLARAVFQSGWFSGCVGAGVALGFALLTKGPVALVMTLIPVAIAALFVRRGAGLRWAAIGAGVFVMLAIALPWFVIVAMREPRAWHVWFTEISRIDATESKPDRWYTYLSIIPYAAPWSVFLIAGLIGAGRAMIRRDNAQLLFAAVMLVVPLLIMSFFKDRAERYMLPVIPAAAAVCAVSWEQTLRAPRAWRITLQRLHWLLVGAVVVGFPLEAAYQLNWFSPSLGLAAAVGFGVIVLIGIALNRRHSLAIVVTTFAVMLAVQPIFIVGYRNTRAGRAELRPLADAIATAFPNAEIYNAHPDGKRPPTELGVYLARTITWIRDPSELSRGDDPKVVLMIQRSGTPDPSPPTRDWALVAKYPRDKDWWWAFVLKK